MSVNVFKKGLEDFTSIYIDGPYFYSLIKQHFGAIDYADMMAFVKDRFPRSEVRYYTTTYSGGAIYDPSMTILPVLRERGYDTYLSYSAYREDVNLGRYVKTEPQAHLRDMFVDIAVNEHTDQDEISCVVFANPAQNHRNLDVISVFYSSVHVVSDLDVDGVDNKNDFVYTSILGFKDEFLDWLQKKRKDEDAIIGETA